VLGAFWADAFAGCASEFHILFYFFYLMQCVSKKTTKMGALFEGFSFFLIENEKHARERLSSHIMAVVTS
jgi:uncharacterized membrane protein YcaP (DUF421 family)